MRGLGRKSWLFCGSDRGGQRAAVMYSYRFLRINRFNLGKDPVQTLSDRLIRLVKKLYNDNEVIAVEQVQAMAGGLASKELKECTRCSSIKPLRDFFDPSLNGGAGSSGRVCMACKNVDAATKASKTSAGGRGHRRYRRRWR
jgi:hypothetical protein